MVAPGEPVSVWCRGPQRAGQYYLYQKGAPQPRRRKLSLGSRDKAKFAIALMTQDLAGTYWCVYVSRGSRSGPSEPLDLVVTGERTLPLAPVMALCPRKVPFPQPGLLAPVGVLALSFHF